jgi:methionyl-tRNA formyltransferase
VITATDKLGGRGKNKLLESAVKKFAVEHDLYVMQPRNLKNPDFVEELRSRKADLQVVVAFRMLPVIVWDMPPMGTLNLHGSLLPKYRGAAPINWAVINGEKETGVTTFLLKHAIDTGDMLIQERIPISPDDTAGDVHDRMMHVGAEVVVRTVNGLENETLTPAPQDESQVSKAPKIFHEMCEVDFHQPACKVHDFIRGLSPFPGAWTTLDGKTLKLLRSELGTRTGTPGAIHIEDNKSLDICCGDGSIRVLELQMEGKRRMKTADFLNGYTISSMVAGHA